MKKERERVGGKKANYWVLRYKRISHRKENKLLSFKLQTISLRNLRMMQQNCQHNFAYAIFQLSLLKM